MDVTFVVLKTTVYNAETKIIKRIYLAKVQDIDHDDDNDEVLISLMSPDLPLNSKMQSFHWPTRVDEIWVKETQSSSISHHPKEQREAFEFRKKFLKILISNTEFTFTIQALIWSNVTYVTDVKQLYQKFCSTILPINDGIVVRLVYLTIFNWISVVGCF